MQDDSEDSISPGIIIRSPGSPRMKHHNSSSNNSNTGNNKEQDRFLPIANVGRIMKKVLPANGKISKDAKETVQECVSEFISFITGEASEKCQREKRKTINGDDLIWSITTLGFEDYVVLLKIYLNKYRDTEGDKINSPKQHNRSEQRQQQQHPQNHYRFQEQEQNISCNNSMIMSHHPPAVLLTTDQHGFPLAFSPNSIQKQFHRQQDQIDSVGQW